MSKQRKDLQLTRRPDRKTPDPHDPLLPAAEHESQSEAPTPPVPGARAEDRSPQRDPADKPDDTKAAVAIGHVDGILAAPPLQRVGTRRAGGPPLIGWGGFVFRTFGPAGRRRFQLTPPPATHPPTTMRARGRTRAPVLALVESPEGI